MTTIQASNFVISTINDFAIEAVKRGMINNEADMASFVDATANYLNVPGEVVMQVVVKIADKIQHI